ncbi:MAG TPA: N,N-dimethylformamidase beta subunit family domain-containing protein [Dehalococcoidia bacterium]|nr:N,N-dimethylformamidase beta subunit family domain-containing protein [Dehalococcoidia bacterium]
MRRRRRGGIPLRPGIVAGLVVIVGLVALVAVLVIRADSIDSGVLPADANEATEESRDAGPRSVEQENLLPGDDTWRIEYPALSQEIQAYTGQASVQRGETLDLYVSTKGGGRFDAEFYRMGWYAGDGGRLVRTVRDIDGRDQGRWDPVGGLRDCATCTVDPATLLVEANWRVSYRLKVPDDWVSGVYLIKLRDQATNTSSYAIFVLRDDASDAPALVQMATHTWQAHNNWGDANLFGSFGADRRYAGPQRRAYRVSYDRPYDMLMGGNYGAGRFFDYEYNFVRWAESQGYAMSYTTSVDVHLRPETLLSRRLFVTVGVDEFWTKQQRDGLEAARAAGVNLAFFGAKAGHWQARMEPSTRGRDDGRVLVSYQEASLDPVSRVSPGETTSEFARPPVNRPPSTLTGVAYGGVVSGGRTTWRAAATETWIYDRTAILPGEGFAGILGPEYDHMAVPEQRPPALTAVGLTAVDGDGIGADTAVSAVHESESGAVVFAAGTASWSWALDDYGHADEGAFADDRLRRVTANVIERLTLPRTVAE